MKGIYINSGIIWNSHWSPAHELTKALAQKNKVYYFENIRIKDRPYSGLYEINKYPVPKNVEIIRSLKIFPKVNLVYFFYNQIFSLRSLWKYRKNIDFLLSYNIYDFLGFLLTKFLKLKTIFMFADEYDILTNWPKFRPILRILLQKHLKYSDKIICTAQELYHRAKKYNSNVYYLPNGVDLQDLEIIQKFQENSMPNKKPKVGYVGSLQNWFDINLIIKAARRYPGIDFEIVGDGAIMPQFTKEKERRKLNNLILIGNVNHAQIYKFSSKFDVALIPFFCNKVTNSVSPIKLFEYWLAKKPVIARKTMELEQFKESLLLYNNEREFFDYLDKFSKKPNRYAHLGKKGFQLVQEKYNWQKYEKIFNNQILI